MPHGPIIEGKIDTSLLAKFKEVGEKLLKESNGLFLRFDLFPPQRDQKNLLKKIFFPAPFSSYQSFQPKYEWVVEINGTEEEIFNSLPSRTRYFIRHAGKKGVRIRIVDKNLIASFADFYSLMTITSKRNGFSLYPQKYYETILQTSEEAGQGFLVLAEYQDKVINGNFVLVSGNNATFVFGGGSRDFKGLSEAYLGQWAGMIEAKRLGATTYSLGGSAPDNKIYKHWDSLQSYKQKFTGHLVEYDDFYDIVRQPFWYWLYNLRKKFKY